MSVRFVGSHMWRLYLSLSGICVDRLKTANYTGVITSELTGESYYGWNQIREMDAMYRCGFGVGVR